MAKTKNAAHDAANEQKETATQTAPTSTTLATLLQQHEEAAKGLAQFPYKSPEWNDAKLKMYTLEAQIKTEEAKIKADQIAAEQAEKRNARVKLAQDLVNAVKKAYGITDTANDDKFAPEYEVVTNELLSKYPATASAAKKSTGDKPAGNGTKGATSQAIRELIVPMYAGATRETVGEIGKTVRKEIIHTHGFNDGTANAVIRAYEVEMGLKD